VIVSNRSEQFILNSPLEIHIRLLTHSGDTSLLSKFFAKIELSG
jgi:hypothetical protein